MPKFDQAHAQAPSPAGPETATQIRPRTRPAGPKRKPLPPCKLILHNDEVNDMVTVVQTIVRLTPLPPPEATRKMLQAHFGGQAILLTTHKERGELYVQQFASCGITTSLDADS